MKMILFQERCFARKEALMFPLTIAGTVGRDWRNDPDDVAPVATALGDLGYVSALPAATSAEWAEDMDDAIRDYQSDRGLKVDGYMRPDGPTIGALNEDRAARQKEQIQIGDPLTPQPASAPRRQSLLNLHGDGAALRPPRQTIYAATPEERALSNAGYTYRPDPMGRIGQGDWLDPSGNVLGVLERRRIAASAPTPAPTLSPVTAAPAAPASTAAGPLLAAAIGGFWQGFRRQIDAARRRAAGGDDPPGVKVSVAGAHDGNADEVASVAAAVNGALGEMAVRRALRGEPMSTDDVGTVVRAVVAAAPAVIGRLAAGGRISDLLQRRERNIHVKDEERHRATSLAAVYRQTRDAAAAENDPDGAAASETARQGQAAVGGTAWTARLVPVSGAATDRAPTRPEAPNESAEHDDPDGADEHETLDDAEVQLASDDPGKDGKSGPKPRGMHNPNTREKASRGRAVHKWFKWYVENDSRKMLRWEPNKNISPKEGKSRLRPDFTIKIGDRYYYLEIKPDTNSGRRAGERQRRLYERISGSRVHLFFYNPSADPPPIGGGGGGRRLPKVNGPSLPGKLLP
jgi:hypothetical protein